MTEAYTSWFADEAARELLRRVRALELGIESIAVRWQVRVDQPHPRRREKAGDFIDMADGQVALAARLIWEGWTPGYFLRVTLADGTTILGPWIERLVCCDMHNVNCEPPSELCCEYCTERNHPNHNRMIPCVLAEVSS